MAVHHIGQAVASGCKWPQFVQVIAGHCQPHPSHNNLLRIYEEPIDFRRQMSEERANVRCHTL